MIIKKNSEQKPNPQKMGGKGVNLLFLSKKNFKVPNFFLIPTDYFDIFVKHNHFEKDLVKVNSKVGQKQLKKTLTELNRKILNGNFPKKLSENIFESFKNIGFKKVSVRSSINVEDGKKLSFAGQFDTYLNVEKKDLINKIKDCWASTFSTRALKYCLFHKIKLVSLKPAVVIQKMINSDKGGVIFTKNISFIKTNELIIEGCKGNGEKIVDGTAEASQYLIDRNSFKIKSINKENDLLSSKELKSLLKIGLNIEKEYGCPQDIEWAIKNSQIYILQSRPITLLQQKTP